MCRLGERVEGHLVTVGSRWDEMSLLRQLGLETTW
jgi:hypothetical protein